VQLEQQSFSYRLVSKLFIFDSSKYINNLFRIQKFSLMIFHNVSFIKFRVSAWVLLSTNCVWINWFELIVFELFQSNASKSTFVWFNLFAVIIWLNWLNVELIFVVFILKFFAQSKYIHINSSRRSTSRATRSSRYINAFTFEEIFHEMMIFTFEIFISSSIAFVTQRILIFDSDLTNSSYILFFFAFDINSLKQRMTTTLFVRYDFL
jgi:hypothetical protein